MSPSIRAATSSSSPSSCREGVVVRFDGVDLDVIVDFDRIGLVLARLDLGEGHDLRLVLLDLGLFVGGSRRRARQRRDMEHRAAFGAENRILIQVVKFRRAGLTLALGAEVRVWPRSLNP